MAPGRIAGCPIIDFSIRLDRGYRSAPVARGTHAHDVFISHASEDKAAVARPLAAALVERGWSAWLDELEMTVGDSLDLRIDQALVQSRFGVVVLSRQFFAKQWTRRELAGLTTREVHSGVKVILPVWHEIDATELAEISPVLADRIGVPTSLGIDHVAEELSRALVAAQGEPASGSAKTVFRAVPISPSRPAASRPGKSEMGRRAGAPARRRSRGVSPRRILGTAAIGAVGSLALMALLPIGESGNSDQHISVAQANVDTPAGWRSTGLSEVDRRRGLTDAVRGSGGTVLFGTLARQDLPMLTSGKAFDVMLPAGRALRADDVKALDAQRIFEFRLDGSSFLVVVCRRAGTASARALDRDCDRIAAAVDLPRPAAAIPRPSRSLQREVSNSLHLYARHRRSAIARIATADSRNPVVSAAGRAARGARRAASLLQQPHLGSLRKALQEAARAWKEAMHAAKRGQVARYTYAGKKLQAAEREIIVDRRRLVGLGYRP